jgi:hypothetical protein
MSENLTTDEIVAMQNGALLGYAIVIVVCGVTYVVLKKLAIGPFKK